MSNIAMIGTEGALKLTETGFKAVTSALAKQSEQNHLLTQLPDTITLRKLFNLDELKKLVGPEDEGVLQELLTRFDNPQEHSVATLMNPEKTELLLFEQRPDAMRYVEHQSILEHLDDPGFRVEGQPNVIPQGYVNAEPTWRQGVYPWKTGNNLPEGTTSLTTWTPGANPEHVSSRFDAAGQKIQA